MLLFGKFGRELFYDFCPSICRLIWAIDLEAYRMERRQKSKYGKAKSVSFSYFRMTSYLWRYSFSFQINPAILVFLKNYSALRNTLWAESSSWQLGKGTLALSQRKINCGHAVNLWHKKRLECFMTLVFDSDGLGHKKWWSIFFSVFLLLEVQGWLRIFSHTLCPIQN